MGVFTRSPVVVLAVLYLASSASAAEIPMDLVTAPAAVLCSTPFQLEEAARAAAGRDEAWLRQLACLQSPAGIPVLRIDPHPRPSQSQPWQVRLQPPGGNGITLWGYFWSFKTKDGATMMELYRAERPRKPGNP